VRQSPPVADYGLINRAAWDERASAHAQSPDYSVERFLEDPAFLSGVVRFDLPRLGSISGLTGVHLQCHIGTDTVSLARLGARMVGLDFSSASLEQARRLASATGADVEFFEADVYDAPRVLGSGRFDLVYTGIGALCWLPDIDRWAAVIAELLAPGGRLFIREGHPMLWSLDEKRQEGLVVDYPYFEREEPLMETADGTYVATDVVFQEKTTYSWNHGLGEVVTALMARGLRITGLVEHDSVPWDALPGQMALLADTGEFRLADRPWRLAHSYTLQAINDPA
jgi:SAM-dependent methyltransferase